MDKHVADDELERLGREVAETVAGASSIEQVEVVPGADYFDRPVYFFTFLIDRDRASQRPGLILIRIMQKLRDELAARGNPRTPVVRLLDRTDWARRAGA